MNTIICGDSTQELRQLQSDSVDLIATDPPYGYSFMGKDWDKAVPSVELWKECLRVLKPGAFCFVMSAPRSDVQMHMIKNLTDAGFRMDFTPIYWTYASGFPKAANIGKIVDKRLGAEREVIGRKPYTNQDIRNNSYDSEDAKHRERLQGAITAPATPEAKELDGSYGGCQPKPAVEVILVAMKPLSEKTFVDQALKNGKGITWLDDVRIPHNESTDEQPYEPNMKNQVYGNGKGGGAWNHNGGRFPANLLVENSVLNDYSRFFSLDEWAKTLPFLIVPKASKSEKNKGLEHTEDKILARSGGAQQAEKRGEDYTEGQGIGINRVMKVKNNHPTVKPLKLMSYLITLGSREDDVVLDPFVGSGTTCLAAKKLKRKYIGIESEPEYVEIAKARLEAAERQATLL